MTTENFADHPPTIGELRSDKSQDAKDWSIRDMLICLLRDIDSGGEYSNANRAVICLGYVGPNGGTNAHVMRAQTQSNFESVGLVTQCLHNMMAGT